MTEVNNHQLRPVWSNVSQSVLIWWKNINKFIAVYLWSLAFALIPLAAAGLLWLASSFLGASGVSLLLRPILIILIFLALLLAFYFTIRGFMGAFLLVKNEYQGRALDIFKDTKDYFWPFLGVSLLSSILILLWSLLLIIPGIIYSILYAFVAYVFFFEGLKGWAALKRSSQLVQGYWWPLFWRFLAGTMILLVFMLVLSWPLYLVPENSSAYWLWNLIVQIISFLIGPITLLYTYHLYQDLKIIKASSKPASVASESLAQQSAPRA